MAEFNYEDQEEIIEVDDPTGIFQEEENQIIDVGVSEEEVAQDQEQTILPKKKKKKKKNTAVPVKKVVQTVKPNILGAPMRLAWEEDTATTTNGKLDFKKVLNAKTQAQITAINEQKKKQEALDKAEIEARYARAAVRKQNNEFLLKTTPPKEYVDVLNQQTQNEINNNGKEVTYMETGTDQYSVPVKRTKIINSFPEEKKEVILELQKAGTLEKYNQKDILNLAAEKYKKKKIASYVNSQSIEYYSNLDDETKALREDYLKKQGAFKSLELEKKATINGNIYKHLNDSSKELDVITKKLKSYGDKPTFKTQEELNDYKKLVTEYDALYTGTKELFNTFNFNNTDIANSSDKLKSVDEEYNLAKRNYGVFTNFGGRVFRGLSSQGASLIQIMNLMSPPGMKESISEYVALSNREQEEAMSAALAPDEEVTDAKSFAKAGFNLVATQLPNWLLMYASGGGSVAAEKAVAEKVAETAVKATAKTVVAEAGLGAFTIAAENNQLLKFLNLAKNKLTLPTELRTIALTSGGSKYNEQVASNALGETNFSPIQMFSASVLYGYSEALGEKVTLDILKAGGRTLEAAVKNDPKFVELLKEKTMKNWFGSAFNFAGSKATDFANENISEQFTNISQNAVDKFVLGKNVNLLDNTGTVFKDTSILTSLMIAAPHVGGLAIKPFLGTDQTKAIRETSAELAKYMELLKNPDLSPAEKKVFEGKIKELTAKSEQIVKNTIKDIDGMPKNTFKTILSSSTQLNSILQQAKEIYNSDSADKMQLIKVLEDQYKEKKYALNSLINRTKMISQLKGEFSNEDKSKLFNLTNREQDLKQEIKDLKNEPNSSAVIAEKSLELKQINEDIGNIVAAEKVAAFTKKTISAAESGGIGDNIFVFNTSEEAEAKAKELGQSLVDEEGNRAEGLEINGNIIIDKQQAAKMFAFNVAGHELLHKVLRKTIYSTEEIKDKEGNVIGQKEVGAVRGMTMALKTYLNNLDPETLNDKDFKARLALYNKEGKSVKAEETLTIFADALRLGELELNETALTKVGDFIRRALQDLGFINIKFKDGKDVLNFLKDYNKAIEKGKLGKAITKVAKEGATVVRGKDGIKNYKDDYISVAKASKSIDERFDDLDRKRDEGSISDEDYLAQYDALVDEEENGPKVQKEVIKEPTKAVKPAEDAIVQDIIKENKGSVSSDKVQQIYEAKGLNGAQDIIDLFKPITNKIVDKRRDAPGFDRDLLTDEVETGEGGILYLIKSYNPEKGVPLAAYINKQLPLRAIAASRRVLDKEFSKDVTEEKGLMAEETVSEVKEKPKYKNAIESKLFSPEVIETANKKALSVVRTLKSDINAPITLNRTVTPLISEIKDEMGKLLDIDIKTAMGGKKDLELEKFLLKGKRYILENMTTTWLMGKNGQGGMPIAIQKQIDGKWISYPDWVDQKIDREKTTTDLAGRTSGAELVRRLPNVANNISDADFLAQIIGPDGNPLRGRKESLAKAMAEEFAFEIIENDLENEGPIYDALITNQERVTGKIIENLPVNFAKQVERGNIKRSKSVKRGIELSVNKLQKDILKAKTESQVVNIVNRWIKSDGRSIRTYSFLEQDPKFKMTTNKAIFENIINEALKSSSKFNYLIGENSFNLKNISGKEEGKYRQSIFFGNELTEKWFSTATLKNDWVKYSNNVLKETKFAKADFFNLVDYYKNPKNKLTEQDLKDHLLLLAYDQQGLNRKLSKPGIGVLGLTKKQEPYLEHNAPALEISNMAIKYYNNEITKKELRSFINNAKVNLVPKALNDFLPDYVKGENRMEAPAVLLELQKLIDAGHKIVGLQNEYGSVANFKNLVALAKTKVNSKANIQNIANTTAVTNSLKSKSVEPKGISVFDFDDTSAFTSGSVLYTMPDGSKGKLNAEEFAKDGSNLLNEGAIFDFSEFSKVVDGKPGPMVEKMKKMISKFGNENFFILTARPANAAVPIKEFLDSMGIDIPLENITGLGNSTAQAKADWMTAKAAEGYNDFYFADDAIQNVEAVKKALQIPGVNSKIQQARAKFSLTSKQDLKWKQGDEDLSTKFTVGNIDYRISMIETAYMEYDDDVQKTLFDLVEENNLDEETTIAAYDGEAYNLEFWDKKQGNGITGTGNAAEVFGIVINGVTDRAKKKNIEALVFTAKEPSRIKLYNSMAEVVANKLGWGAYYKDGVYILAKKSKSIGSTTGVGSLKPVKDVLNVVDINSPINQSKAKFSKSISLRFNEIIEANTGMENYKVFSDIVARRRGVNKNKFDFYVPPSAADFELLLYNFIGKGQVGEEQQKFFADALLKPYANGNDLMDAARQSIKNDYKALINQFPGIKKKIESLTPDGDFTYDQAIRVALWTEEGVEIPGISQRDQTKLTELVNNDPELNAFKQGVLVTGRQGKGWIAPTEYWDASTIISDLHNLTEGAGRKKFLAEFIENTEEMFGKFENGKLVGPNINKVEAVYGTNVREALDDQLYRMINGKNRSYGSDKETSMWSNWVNGSTGAIMFLNTRSAVLQLLGAVNFLNLRDNNPVAAGIAFANQKQYWEDFSRIWNSDKIKERRGGLKEDVAAAEIANAAAGSKNKVNAVISYLLKIGYTPTQLADSFAIASGGAPFYRNRINTYLKEGQSQEDAEKNAWNDFTKVSDETQQSGDPRDISKQQASPAGRLLLTFQNFSMQQSRIVKKSFLDLKNGRGDAKTHVSKIIYYLAVQNILFATLQQGLFAVAFDDDDEELDKEKDKAKKKTLNERLVDVADGVLDTILRGTGFVGGVISVLKNMTKKYLDEKDKGFKADYAKVMLEGANISPPIGSKLRKVYTGLQQTKFEKDLIDERGWGVMQDGRVHLGPMYGVTGKLVEATTNVPMDRLANKIENVSQAMNSQNKAWQRVAVGFGFTPYSVGIEDTKGDLEIRAKAKETRKEAGKTKRSEASKRERDSIANLSPDAYMDFVKARKEARERKKDSIANLPADQKKAYLEKKAIEAEARKREKEALKKIKADSIAGLSPGEKAKYDKQVAAEKAEKKKERHEKYLEKKKALQDSLAGLSPKEREKYKAKKKAERHQYYIEHKKPSKKKKAYEIKVYD